MPACNLLFSTGMSAVNFSFLSGITCYVFTIEGEVSKHRPVTVVISGSYIHTNGVLGFSNLSGFVGLQAVGGNISEKYANSAQK